MRRSIYNDYRPLRIALLLLLVVLGLLIYMNCSAPCEHVGDSWVVSKEANCTDSGLRHKVCTECDTPFGHETIPAKGHSPLAATKENEVDSTCTKGGSYDSVVYCKDCDTVLDRETVALEVLPHTPGKVKVEDKVESTHATAGSYNDVIRCTECDKVLETVEKEIPAMGHDYTKWTAEYDETTGKFVFTGKCSCSEHGNTVVFTEDDVNENLTITIKYNSKYAPCCKNEYFVEIVYKYQFNGKNLVKTFTDKIELEPESHKLIAEKVVDIDGNVTVGYISVTQFAKYDEFGAYYDLADEVVKEHVDVAEDAVWSDNGFTTAYFICKACDDADCAECADDYTWFAVRLYSADKDVNKD